MVPRPNVTTPTSATRGARLGGPVVGRFATAGSLTPAALAPPPEPVPAPAAAAGLEVVVVTQAVVVVVVGALVVEVVEDVDVVVVEEVDVDVVEEVDVVDVVVVVGAAVVVVGAAVVVVGAAVVVVGALPLKVKSTNVFFWVKSLWSWPTYSVQRCVLSQVMAVPDADEGRTKTW
ncbi:MAG: hypothetical protein ACYDH6_23360 [Acidimicrobiales bacterium]